MLSFFYTITWLSMTVWIAAMVHEEPLLTTGTCSDFHLLFNWHPYNHVNLSMLIIIARCTHLGVLYTYRCSGPKLLTRDITELWARRINFMLWVRTLALILWTYTFFYAKAYKFGTAVIIGYGVLVLLEYGAAFSHIERERNTSSVGGEVQTGHRERKPLLGGKQAKQANQPASSRVRITPVVLMILNLVSIAVLVASTSLYYAECVP